MGKTGAIRVAADEREFQQLRATPATVTGAHVLGPLSPGADGLFSFIDTNAPSGTAYYRSGPR